MVNGSSKVHENQWLLFSRIKHTQFYFSYDIHQVNVWVQIWPSNLRKHVEVAKLCFPPKKLIHYSFCLMVVDEWHNNGPQDLITVSLCIQNAINKMHLCLLSITYACPYHNPTATMGHSTSATAHPHDAIHAVCHLPCTVKTGIHPWREHLSKVPDAIECEHLPTQVGYDDELQSGRDPDEDDEHADELRWDSLCGNSLVIQTDCCSSCPSGWSQIILEVKMLDVEVLDWCGYTWSAVARLVECRAKFSETPLETAYGREMNMSSSGGHSCSQHASCTLPQNLQHLWHCAVW